MITVKYNARFKYVQIANKARPYVQVIVQLRGSSFSVPFLVDSGADKTSLPRIWFPNTELSSYRRTRLGGVGGGCDAWEVPLIVLKIGDLTIRCPALIEDTERTFGLLGRERVFDLAQFGFRQRKNEFYIAHQG